LDPALGVLGLLTAVLTGIGEAFRRGLFVPRFVYDREVERADKLEVQLERMAEAFEAMTDEIRRDRESRSG
jgi:hypothetical protein